MRKIKKYKKENGTKKQQEKLKAINEFKDEIANYYFDTRYKKNKK